MPALPPYIPAPDGAFQSWLLNFSTLLTANPMSFGQTSGVAASVAMAYSDWYAAYTLSQPGPTRTAATVAAKNTARIAAQSTVRPVAQQISLNPGVSSGNKIAIGVNPRTSTPAPITAPGTNPILSITAALPLQHIIRYRDSTASPSVKSKPYGVQQIQLSGETSSTPITDPTTLPLLQLTTKSPFSQSWPSGVAGVRAYYAARWVTAKGLVGPWSPIASFIVAN